MIHGIPENIKPAFLYKSTGQNNVGTAATTIEFATKKYDLCNNFASHTFTAPVYGWYTFSWSISMSSLDTAALYFDIQLLAVGTTYHAYYSTKYSADSYGVSEGTRTLELNKGDTALLKYLQLSGAAQTDVQAESYFEGRYIYGSLY